MAEKRKGKAAAAPAPPPPPPPPPPAAVAKPPEKKEGEGQADEDKEKEPKKKSVQPKHEVGTRKGCRRYWWEFKDSNKEFWVMGHAEVKILSLGCLIASLVVLSSMPVHPILPLLITMEISIFSFFMIVYTFAINRYMPFILWPIADLLNDLIAFAFLVGAVVFAVRIRSSLPTVYLIGLERKSHLTRLRDQKQTRARQRHQQQHQPRQQHQPKERGSDLEKALLVRNGSVFYSKPLSPRLLSRMVFFFHFNNHLCLEKKCLCKSILKVKVAVNIILFIQQKLPKVTVQRAVGPGSRAVWRPEGTEVWVTLAANTDQPEWPGRHENLEGKRMHFCSH
ncbi:PREDICTED: CKLF-like MARVEL transmembrane domain-containing protein 2 [Propithecus coquereli]|uniref:CKLF-like MARVEL transmembrane domain-containing protein 2 n=1 Tax=Propithecus coquereli TaxID=379532 RepID=UPI00063FCF72|nr:PREDICTED: CKLF-like MARVEL transmembrane domain-containing protein 2 [Propithecus coquereli]